MAAKRAVCPPTARSGIWAPPTPAHGPHNSRQAHTRMVAIVVWATPSMAPPTRGNQAYSDGCVVADCVASGRAVAQQLLGGPGESQGAHTETRAQLTVGPHEPRMHAHVRRTCVPHGYHLRLACDSRAVRAGLARDSPWSGAILRLQIRSMPVSDGSLETHARLACKSLVIDCRATRGARVARVWPTRDPRAAHARPARDPLGTPWRPTAEYCRHLRPQG